MKASSTFFRLFSIIKPQIPILSLGVLSEIVKYGVTLWIGLLGVTLLSAARSGEDASVLLPIGLLMLTLAIVRGFSGYLSPYLCHVGAYRLLADLRDQFYRTIEPLAPAALMSRRTGDVVSIAANNVETLELFFAHTIAPLISAIIIPCFVFISLVLINPIIGGVYAVIALLIALIPKMSLYLNEKNGEGIRVLLADIHSFLIDSIQGIREILAFSRSVPRYERIMDLNDKYQAEYNNYVRNNSFVTISFLMLLSGGIIILLVVSSCLVQSGLIKPIQIPIIILFASVGYASMTNIVEISKQFSLTIAGAKRLFELMDLEPDIRESQDPVRPDNISPSLVVENISFRYKPEDPYVLTDISFSVPKGKTVALVGMTGAGKTTISHLIMRFWDPQAGRILLGDYDIRSLSLSYLRDQVAMVTQDIFLLNTSIMENIRLGRSDATDEEVISAAVTARIHTFITSLPKGYETFVGERGIRLSGGERQRIAIARAVLKNAPVLILDEATSALDTVTEIEIREALNELSGGKTVLIIAHRLSTIVHADEILVLKGGHVVERGTHKELLDKKGVYYSLIQAQEI